MLQLYGFLGAGHGTQATALADGFDDLGLGIAASILNFLNSPERTGGYALAATHASGLIDLGYLRIGFQLIPGEQGQDFGCSGRALAY
jgi:hypothetical protein